jgi:hypothetical protein
MARILICHVPKDAAAARELGGSLMGRGHSVSFDGEPDLPRGDRSARLRQFEAAIVIWSDASLMSKGALQIATEALALNQLIGVRLDGIPVERLALAFRKLNSFAISDVDGMARFVSRLSSAAASLKQMQQKEEERREAQKKGVLTDLEEAQKREIERKEKERLEVQLILQRKRERERRERERLEAELAEAERKERERREEEELEARLAEMQRKERERQEQELLEGQALDAQRKERERQEHERQEREFEAQLADARRKERERLEEEVFQAQIAELQRQERERQERERREAEFAEAQRRERERQDGERVEALRHEVERRERERREREWVEAQLFEVQRKERERQERDRLEREKFEAQLIELQRREKAALVTVADWQPVAVAQGQAATWSPAAERASAVLNVVEASNGRASDYAPPPLPYQNGGNVSAAQVLAQLAQPPRENPSTAGTILFMHEVPERMWLGEPALVRVCLGRGTIAGFSRTFAARAGLDLEGDPVAETVSMSLYGRGDVFEIERQSERVQLLPSNHLLDSPLELADYGRWVWHVTPIMPGEHELFLRVSALFRDRRGVPTPVALPDQKVDVFVPTAAGGSIIQSLAGWLRR